MSTIPEDVRKIARHLKLLSDDDLTQSIRDAEAWYIKKVKRKTGDTELIDMLTRYLAAHYATINLRRPDSQSLDGMNKSISVPKDMGLEQTEYGQMAKDIMDELGVSVKVKPVDFEVF